MTERMGVTEGGQREGPNVYSGNLQNFLACGLQLVCSTDLSSYSAAQPALCNVVIRRGNRRFMGESMLQSSVYWMDGTAEQATTALCAGDINIGEFACTGGLILREVLNTRPSRHATLPFSSLFVSFRVLFHGFFSGAHGIGFTFAERRR